MQNYEKLGNVVKHIFHKQCLYLLASLFILSPLCHLYKEALMSEDGSQCCVSLKHTIGSLDVHTCSPIQ